MRAAAGLARPWHDQGYRAEARDRLAPVYAWFTKGCAAPELKEAKALVNELSALSTMLFITGPGSYSAVPELRRCTKNITTIPDRHFRLCSPVPTFHHGTP